MLSYIISIITQLKWAWEILFQRSLFGHRIHDVPEICEELNLVQHSFKTPESNNEALECAVCLCKIEEGEEISELRCDHRFHRGCLDRWIGYKRATCPLCRDYLASGRTIWEYGMQVLVFKKFSSVSSSESDTWWLR